MLKQYERGVHTLPSTKKEEEEKKKKTNSFFNPQKALDFHVISRLVLASFLLKKRLGARVLCLYTIYIFYPFPSFSQLNLVFFFKQALLFFSSLIFATNPLGVECQNAHLLDFDGPQQKLRTWLMRIYDVHGRFSLFFFFFFFVIPLTGALAGVLVPFSSLFLSSFFFLQGARGLYSLGLCLDFCFSL
ncbi:hypothetical protein GGI43DRAFT_319001 [Trichoderma evansii]